MIELAGVSVEFRGENNNVVSAVDNCSFEVETGKCVSLVGPSGCGKSTILSCIAGLLAPTSGNINLSGMDTNQARQSHKIAHLAQRPVFFDWFSIRKNLEIASEISGGNKNNFLENDMLAQFGLSDFADAYPHQLSGGMLARLAIARAFVSKPEFLLLDEAFNFLDEILRSKINDDVQSFILKTYCTAILVTHSISEAVYLSDKILVLSHRPARLIEIIDVPFDRPRTRELTLKPEFLALCEQVRLIFPSD